MLGFIGGFQYFKRKETKGVMSVVANLYEKPSASNKAFLMKCLFKMKMLEGRSVVNHLNYFNIITSQLIFVKVNFDYEVRYFLNLFSFP